ncbi:hypothetical protein L6R49_28440 [Myxococcota bacterium]|nr:hypothetical protein [Myxococcota bacterium]
MSDSLTLRATGALSLPDRALTRLTALEHGLFALCAAVAGAGLLLLPVAQARPALAVGLAFGLALGAVRPWAPLLVPAFMALTLGAALGADRIGAPSVVVTALVAGLVLGARRAPEGDGPWFYALNAGLAAAMGAGLLAWAAARAGFNEATPQLAASAFGAGLGLWPGTLRFREVTPLPTAASLAASLPEPYVQAPTRALELYNAVQTGKVDPETLDGLAEVLRWIVRLAESLRTLDEDLRAADPVSLRERAEAAIHEAETSDDEFIRDRRLATAKHLEQILRHREQVELERRRTESLQEYALAYLEEARMGLVLARALPGERSPDRLDEVLMRLREHAKDGDNRRRTAREVQKVL